MSRPTTTTCENCGETIEQQRLGAPRRFCLICRYWRERDRSQAWKDANPEKHRQHKRESMKRRRQRRREGR